MEASVDKMIRDRNSNRLLLERASLRGFYVIGLMSSVLGFALIIVLNLTTPLAFFLNRMAELTLIEIGSRFLVVMAVSCSIFFIFMTRLVKPIALYLEELGKGQEPSRDGRELAQRRLLNLPFLFIPVNIGIWLVVPALVFSFAFLRDLVDFRTALVLAARTSMVGFVASAIGFFGIESHSRRHLIPLLFPRGRLADLTGAARISISRRIRMLFRFGTIVPMVILLVTLITLQWEVDSTVLSAKAYGRGIILFTMIMGIAFFIVTGFINRMVSSSIVTPIQNILDVVPRLQEGLFDTRIEVISNDEIGILSDAGNAMIRGLAERDLIKDTFGRYVTPEIRDEILSGRIPLEGERRHATVMFADLRGFTPFVENNSPEEVISTMRDYFTAMHRAIRREGGLVLQFVGDEIEAVFGVPVSLSNHEEAGIKAALEMCKALENLNRERERKGKPALEHGIGIHSGRVLAGNSGSEEQSAYALIGDAVNIASRIQELTKEMNCRILASMETVQGLKEGYHLEKKSPVMVKGYSKPILLFDVPDHPASA
jgi:class 3 adenylate cyclase